MTVTPIELFGAPVRLRADGQVQTEPPTAEMDLEGDGWLLMVAHASTDADVHADHWEIHTEGDELVTCLSGGLRIVLRRDQPGGDEQEIVLSAGTAAVVPRGRWHRLVLDTPSDMLAVTLPRGTREERWTGG